MTIIRPSYRIEPIDSNSILKQIERYGRVCYKSEGRITPESAEPFIKRIIRSGHESVLEHASITVTFICDRGVSHEIVRHRIGSYSQESTRYTRYGKEAKAREVTFIKPFFYKTGSEEYKMWKLTMGYCEDAYLSLLKAGSSPQKARSVLPNSLKTEIVCTYNLREWRHFFKLRTSPKAHPQMRELTIPLLAEFKSQLPVVFEDCNM